MSSIKGEDAARGWPSFQLRGRRPDPTPIEVDSLLQRLQSGRVSLEAARIAASLGHEAAQVALRAMGEEVRTIRLTRNEMTRVMEQIIKLPSLDVACALVALLAILPRDTPERTARVAEYEAAARLVFDIFDSVSLDPVVATAQHCFTMILRVLFTRTLNLEALPRTVWIALMQAVTLKDIRQAWLAELCPFLLAEEPL